jgi:hypothetical protein
LLHEDETEIASYGLVLRLLLDDAPEQLLGDREISVAQRGL